MLRRNVMILSFFFGSCIRSVYIIPLKYNINATLRIVCICVVAHRSRLLLTKQTNSSSSCSCSSIYYQMQYSRLMVLLYYPVFCLLACDFRISSFILLLLLFHFLDLLLLYHTILDPSVIFCFCYLFACLPVTCRPRNMFVVVRLHNNSNVT